MMFATAVKGGLHGICFFLEQGAKPTANEAEGDDGVPFHAAAVNGLLDWTKTIVGKAVL